MNKKIIKITLVLLIISITLLFLSCGNGIDVFSSSEIELVQLTFLYSDRDQVWSPSGEKLIFVRKTGNADDIWKADIKTRKVSKLQILGTDPAWHPSKKNTIIYQKNGNIIKKGVSLKQLTNTGYLDHHPAWNSNGNKIAFTRSMDVETIWIMDPDGTNQTQLTSISDQHCFSPSFNFDGSKIVYIKSSEQESDINEIWVMNSDGSNKQVLFAPGDTKQTISNRAWNQKSEIIFTRSYPKGLKPSTASDLWMINADGSGATAILESYVYSYNSPVWNKQGNKIALNVNSFVKDKSTSGANIYIFSYE